VDLKDCYQSVLSMQDGALESLLFSTAHTLGVVNFVSLLICTS
jgi:hypothetical protein